MIDPITIVAFALVRPADPRRFPGHRRRSLRLLDGVASTASTRHRCESLRGWPNSGGDGGTLAIMAGNHDAWLCPFYEDELGETI